MPTLGWRHTMGKSNRKNLLHQKDEKGDFWSPGSSFGSRVIRWHHHPLLWQHLSYPRNSLLFLKDSWLFIPWTLFLPWVLVTLIFTWQILSIAQLLSSMTSSLMIFTLLHASQLTPVAKSQILSWQQQQSFYLLNIKHPAPQLPPPTHFKISLYTRVSTSWCVNFFQPAPTIHHFYLSSASHPFLHLFFLTQL